MVYDIIKLKIMKIYRFILFFIATFLFVGTQLAYGVATSATPYPLSHYSVIMERAPFGPLPKKLTPEEQAAAEAAAAEANATEEVNEDVLPPSFEQIKVTALTMFGGKPAAGFTDGAINKSYYLREGEEFENYLLVNVDFDGMQITLRRDDIESVLPLWINPATTNCADISSFGVADPSSMASTTAFANKNSSVAPVAQGANNATKKSDEELERERRRAEWRKKRDEERERRRKELEAMTPEEREQHLRKVNMDLIRSGDGPPLPIELNQEEMEQLASEGFAVPGINAPLPEGADAAGAPPQGRHRRGRIRSPGGFQPQPGVGAN